MLETGAQKGDRGSKAVPLLIAVALAVVLGSLAYWAWMRDAARPPEQIVLTDEAREYLPMLDLKDVEMVAEDNTLGQTLVEITGTIENLGPLPVRSIRLNCVFFDPYGIEMYRVLSTIVHSRDGLPPSSSREFRLPFDDIPDGWNQVLPSLYIAEIVFD